MHRIYHYLVGMRLNLEQEFRLDGCKSLAMDTPFLK